MPAGIYLDESGDLGFDFTKQKTSRYFTITCLFVKNSRSAEKIVRRIIKKLPRKERMRHSGVLHANKETVTNRNKMLLSMVEQNDNISVISVCIDKTKIHTSWQSQKHALYNTLTNIIIDRIYERHIANGERVDIVASQRETKSVLNREFVEFLETELENNRNLKVHIEVKTPTREKCLQLADIASWSIFRDLEHGDNTYRKILAPIIIEQMNIF